MREKENGFTLIELMVTIAVMAIIAMMAVPSFSNMLLKQNLKKSTQELANVLVQAISTIIITSTRQYVNCHPQVGRFPCDLRHIKESATAEVFREWAPFSRLLREHAHENNNVESKGCWFN